MLIKSKQSAWQAIQRQILDEQISTQDKISAIERILSLIGEISAQEVAACCIEWLRTYTHLPEIHQSLTSLLIQIAQRYGSVSRPIQQVLIEQKWHRVQEAVECNDLEKLKHNNFLELMGEIPLEAITDQCLTWLYQETLTLEIRAHLTGVLVAIAERYNAVREKIVHGLFALASQIQKIPFLSPFYQRLIQALKPFKATFNLPEDLFTQVIRNENNSNESTTSTNATKEETDSLKRPMKISNSVLLDKKSSEKKALRFVSNFDYYQAMEKALKKLGSLALADSKGSDNELLHYLKCTIKKSNAMLAENCWDLFAEQARIEINDPSASFPKADFESFKNDPKKQYFFLPLLFKRAHFMGVVFHKIDQDKLQLIYFNPTGHLNELSAEDQEALGKLKEALSPLVEDVEALFTAQNVLSNQQQINGIDCAYIVGQTLSEIANEIELSIKPYDGQNIEAYVKPISLARMHFYDVNIVGEQYAVQVKTAWIQRLAKAVSTNENYAIPLRDFIKLNERYREFDRDIASEVSRFVFIMDAAGQELETIEGSLLEDKAFNFLLKELNGISIDKIQTFCEKLLEPVFPEYGDVLFKLNSTLMLEKKAENQTHSDQKIAEMLQEEEFNSNRFSREENTAPNQTSQSIVKTFGEKNKSSNNRFTPPIENVKDRKIKAVKKYRETENKNNQQTTEIPTKQPEQILAKTPVLPITPIKNSDKVLPEHKINKIKSRLKNQYKKNTEIKIIKDYTFDLSQENTFINLSIVQESDQREKEEKHKTQQGDYEASFKFHHDTCNPKPGKNITWQTLFKDCDFKKSQQKILIEGRPGIGKTTLLLKLSYEWANQDTKPFKQRIFKENELVIYISLRKLLDNKNKKFSPIEFLNIQIGSPIKDEYLDSFKEWLEENQNQIIFLIDGYDEIENHTENLKKFLDFFFKFNRIVLTSRPNVLFTEIQPYVEDESLNAGILPLHQNTDDGITLHYRKPQQPTQEKIIYKRTTFFNPTSLLEVVGFKQEEIKHYIENYPALSQEKKKKLLCFLNKNQFFKGLLNIPINALLICEIWKKIEDENQLTTLTQFYQALIKGLKKCFIERFEYGEKEAERKWQGYETLLSYLAYQGIHRNEIYFSKNDLEKGIKQLKNTQEQGSFENVEYEFIKIGLLKKTAHGEFYFLHLSFQEYFAGLYLFHSIELNVFDFQQNEFYLDKEEFERLIAENKFNPLWQYVLAYTAGQLATIENTGLIKQAFKFFYGCLFNNPREIFPSYEMILFANCFEESLINKEVKNLPEFKIFSTNMLGWINKNCDKVVSNNVIIIGEKHFLTDVFKFYQNCLRSTDVFNFLIEKIFNPTIDIGIKTRCMKLLVELDYSDIGQIDKFLSILEDENSIIKTETIKILGNIIISDNKIIDSLFKLLRNDKELGIKLHVIQSLGKLGVALNKLIKILSNPEEENWVIEAAIEACIQLIPFSNTENKNKIEKLLMPFLYYEDEYMRVKIIEAFGLLGYVNKRILKSVIAALSDKEEVVSDAAINTLVKLHRIDEQRVLSQLLETLKSENDEEEQVGAITTLVRLNQEDKAIAELYQLLIDDQYSQLLKENSLKLLFYLAEEFDMAAEKLIELLIHSNLNSDLKIDIALSLVELGKKGEEIITVLSNALHEIEDDKLRVGISHALIDLGYSGDKPVEILYQALDHKDEEIKIDATFRLISLGKKDKEVVGILKSFLKNSEKKQNEILANIINQELTKAELDKKLEMSFSSQQDMQFLSEGYNESKENIEKKIEELNEDIEAANELNLQLVEALIDLVDIEIENDLFFSLLIGIFISSDEEMYDQAVSVLIQFIQTSQHLEKIIEELLHIDISPAQFSYIKAFGLVENAQETISILKHYYYSEAYDIRRGIEEAISKNTKKNEIIKIILDLLPTEKIELKVAALEFLSAMNDTSEHIVKAIIDRLNDENKHIREKASSTLLRLSYLSEAVQECLVNELSIEKKNTSLKDQEIIALLMQNFFTASPKVTFKLLQPCYFEELKKASQTIIFSLIYKRISWYIQDKELFIYFNKNAIFEKISIALDRVSVDALQYLQEEFTKLTGWNVESLPEQKFTINDLLIRETNSNFSGNTNNTTHNSNVQSQENSNSYNFFPNQQSKYTASETFRSDIRSLKGGYQFEVKKFDNNALTIKLISAGEDENRKTRIQNKLSICKEALEEEIKRVGLDKKAVIILDENNSITITCNNPRAVKKIDCLIRSVSENLIPEQNDQSYRCIIS